MLSFAVVFFEPCAGCVAVDLLLWRPFFATSRDTSPAELLRRNQLLHTEQIVRRGDQAKQPIDSRPAAQLHLPRCPVLLGPAEDLLHELALPLADHISFAAAFLLSEPVGPFLIRHIIDHMRCDATCAQLTNKPLLLIAFVRAQSALHRAFQLIHHHQCSVLFGRLAGLRHHRGHHQPVAVLRQHMAQVVRSPSIRQRCDISTTATP